MLFLSSHAMYNRLRLLCQGFTRRDVCKQDNASSPLIKIQDAAACILVMVGNARRPPVPWAPSGLAAAGSALVRTLEHCSRKFIFTGWDLPMCVCVCSERLPVYGTLKVNCEAFDTPMTRKEDCRYRGDYANHSLWHMRASPEPRGTFACRDLEKNAVASRVQGLKCRELQRACRCRT
jgi:hypothetical protein